MRRDALPDKIGKISRAWRAITPRKDAASRLSKTSTSHQERSGGKVIKLRKGTPKKIQNVEKLRRLFETSTRSPTRGHVELLPQICKGLGRLIFILLSQQQQRGVGS